MQIVIDIPDAIYEEVMSGDWSNFAPYGFCEAIENGAPLPKGHGGLIDRNELLKEPMDTANYPSNYVRIAKAIIEADKAESEEQNENNTSTR